MKDYGLYVEQILTAMRRIAEYTASGEEDFLASTLLQDGVIRNLQVIGQAVKRIPDDVRSRYPDIPWRSMTGLRDVVVHDYDALIFAEIWTIIGRDLLPLEPRLTEILHDLDQRRPL